VFCRNYVKKQKMIFKNIEVRFNLNIIITQQMAHKSRRRQSAIRRAKRRAIQRAIRRARQRAQRLAVRRARRRAYRAYKASLYDPVVTIFRTCTSGPGRCMCHRDTDNYGFTETDDWDNLDQLAGRLVYHKAYVGMPRPCTHAVCAAFDPIAFKELRKAIECLAESLVSRDMKNAAKRILEDFPSAARQRTRHLLHCGA
jgi:hypothetical protein